jgi:hypothetical protein
MKLRIKSHPGQFARSAGLLIAGLALISTAGCLPGSGGPVSVHGAQDGNGTLVQQTAGNVSATAGSLLPVVVVADNITRKPVCPNAQNIQLPETHVTLNCTDCHADLTIIAALKTSPGDCNACHQKDDKHKGSYGTACGQCHGAVSWKEATIDHSTTSYPLTGKHISVPCMSCHLNSVYKGTPTACSACHNAADVHKGAFGQNCGDCHTTAAWKPAAYNKPHTAFPLNHGVGRNAAATPCSTCHTTSLLTYTCYGCHAHTAASIQRQHRNTQNVNDCMRCHQSGRSHGSD